MKIEVSNLSYSYNFNKSFAVKDASTTIIATKSFSFIVVDASFTAKDLLKL